MILRKQNFINYMIGIFGTQIIMMIMIFANKIILIITIMIICVPTYNN
jgi:uncharacterized membrane protein